MPELPEFKAYIERYQSRPAVVRAHAKDAELVAQTVTFSMLWPASRYASPKLRAFIDYMVENMRI